jgi:hypothetical protein
MAMDSNVWLPGERIVTRDGTTAVVVAIDPRGNVLALEPFASIPRVVRPVCDAWGGEHDCELRNAA